MGVSHLWTKVNNEKYFTTFLIVKYEKKKNKKILSGRCFSSEISSAIRTRTRRVKKKFGIKKKTIFIEHKQTTFFGLKKLFFFFDNTPP